MQELLEETEIENENSNLNYHQIKEWPLAQAVCSAFCYIHDNKVFYIDDWKILASLFLFSENVDISNELRLLLKEN